MDTGANLDDVNCDYLGTCYDGENNFFSFLKVLCNEMNILWRS